MTPPVPVASPAFAQVGCLKGQFTLGDPCAGDAEVAALFADSLIFPQHLSAGPPRPEQ